MDEKPSQNTPKGYEIPAPTHAEIDRALERAALIVGDDLSSIDNHCALHGPAVTCRDEAATFHLASLQVGTDG
jgi:hypothetical protein